VSLYSRISIVVATWNRCQTLQRTITHIQAQTVLPDGMELIVVDDGSSDGTGEMVEAMRPRCDFPVRYFWHSNRGPGYTQNVGIQQATYDLILLLADDIWPTPGLVAAHLAAHENHPQEHIAVLGDVITSPELPASAINRAWDPFQYGRFRGRNELEGIFFHACNISVKKSFLLAHGLFKERQAAAHEDIELGYRLSQKGLRILFDGNALAHHYHPETIDRVCKRAYERGYNFDLLTQSLPANVVFPLYKILSPRAGWKAFFRTLPRECARAAIFNQPMVETIWLPILRRADSSRWAEALAIGALYRGVAGCYMRKGYRDKQLHSRTLET
jgi:glycosyltransferase involved in cell wall biosynthesis